MTAQCKASEIRLPLRLLPNADRGSAKAARNSKNSGEPVRLFA